MVREKVPVSARALLQRINRALAKADEQLKKCREGRSYQDLGEYFVIHVKRNYIVSTDVDLEDLGQKLKVLKPWEKLEEK